jgi:alcohol dehydrogenase
MIHATFWPKFACAGKEMGVTDFINSKASGRPVHEVLHTYSTTAWSHDSRQSISGAELMCVRAGDQGDDGWGCRLQLRVHRDQSRAA